MNPGFLLRSALAAVGCAMSVAALAACSPSSTPANCPPPHPTFRLTVSCLQAAVPDDLSIKVVYSSGVEEFHADNPDDTPKSVFCTVQYADAEDASADQEAGADGGSPEITRVVCDLWTDGAAEVTVKASGYPELTEQLSADSDDCGLKLTDAEMTLEPAD